MCCRSSLPGKPVCNIWSCQQPLSKLALQALETLVGLVGLIKLVVEDGPGQVSAALQEAARHLHDQGMLVSAVDTDQPAWHAQPQLAPLLAVAAAFFTCWGCNCNLFLSQPQSQ